MTNGPQYYSDFGDTAQKVALVWRSSHNTISSLSRSRGQHADETAY